MSGGRHVIDITRSRTLVRSLVCQQAAGLAGLLSRALTLAVMVTLLMARLAMAPEMPSMLGGVRHSSCLSRSEREAVCDGRT